MSSKQPASTTTIGDRPLTQRQAQIATLVMRGKTSREIGEELFIDSRTVDTHIEAICNKLGVRTRVELAVALIGSDAVSAKPVTRHAKNTNIPFARTKLVGRETEFTDLVEELGTSQLMTITGAGGIGKTRIALAVGSAMIDKFPDGVWLVELASLADSSFVAAAIARTVNITESPNRPALETLLTQLKQKSLLLVLDNCEHLIVHVAAIANTLLGGCPHLRILATSREPLRIAGERTYRLPSLPFPSTHETFDISAVAAAKYAAVTLFSQRAGAVDRHFTLSDKNAPFIAEICRRLDGIALAIELAAARVNILPVPILNQRLDQRFGLLSGGDRTALPRQQTMRALIDWSYDLLTLREQRLFEQLSIFAGGCTSRMAAAVFASESADDLSTLLLLSSLVDKSLVVSDLESSEPRYRLLESSREYAYEKLVARGDRAHVARLHAQAYFDLAERSEREHDVAPNSAWFARARLEIENWRAALHWAFGEQGDIILGQRLAGAMRAVWLAFSISEGRHWLHTALNLVDHKTPRSVAAHLQYAGATVAYLFCEFETALNASRHLIGEYQEIGEALGAARARFVAGRSLANLGRVAEGEPLLQIALEAARALGNAPLVGLALAGIARARSSAGDLATARAHLAEAFAIYDSIGAEGYPVVVMSAAANTEFSAGNLEQAVHLSTTALSALRSFGFTLFVTIELNYLAGYLFECRRWHDAQSRAHEALQLALETHQDVEVAWALQHLAAAVAASRTDAKSASSQLDDAARLIGYVNTRIAELSTSRQRVSQQQYDRVLLLLRATRPRAQLEKLFSSGAGMTQDQAIHLARSL